MTVFHLVKRGYGTVAEIEEWDSPQFFNAIEFEKIQNDIEWKATRPE